MDSLRVRYPFRSLRSPHPPSERDLNIPVALPASEVFLRLVWERQANQDESRKTLRQRSVHLISGYALLHDAPVQAGIAQHTSNLREHLTTSDH